MNRLCMHGSNFLPLAGDNDIDLQDSACMMVHNHRNWICSAACTFTSLDQP